MIIKDEAQLTQAVLAEAARTPDPRQRQILESLIRHLHGFAREVRLTEKEFDQAINLVTALGHMTTESHNETRLIAGSLGLSMLVCLMNNGEGGRRETSANLLGPFWRAGAPRMPNGACIVRSPTPGLPMFFTGRILDTAGKPVAGAEIDVWHASPDGLYENQDPSQAEWNLRGRFTSDEHGVFAYRSVKPAGYPVPMAGPTGALLRAQGRHPFRPAHLHSLIYKPGFKTMTSQIYSHDDPLLESDAQFGVTQRLVGHYVLHESESAPDRDVQGPWYSLEHEFVLEPGEAWLPTPPVSAKKRRDSAQPA
jgi:protocatechuate 3,4-dioxygenase beta subunit